MYDDIENLSSIIETQTAEMEERKRRIRREAEEYYKEYSRERLDSGVICARLLKALSALKFSKIDVPVLNLHAAEDDNDDGFTLDEADRFERVVISGGALSAADKLVQEAEFWARERENRPENWDWENTKAIFLRKIRRFVRSLTTRLWLMSKYKLADKRIALTPARHSTTYHRTRARGRAYRSHRRGAFSFSAATAHDDGGGGGGEPGESDPPAPNTYPVARPLRDRGTSFPLNTQPLKKSHSRILGRGTPRLLSHGLLSRKEAAA